jgi:hypothetical protein
MSTVSSASIAVPDSGAIPRTLELPRSQNFAYLRARGVHHIERLASSLWTDYNVHDPGITLLELFCYAITDLSLRAGYPIQDLLAESAERLAASGRTSDFHQAHEVLVCRPVSFDDLRRLLIDVEGVRNAWIERHRGIAYNLDTARKRLTNAAADETIELNGLFDVYLEYEDVITEAQEPFRTEMKRAARAAAIERIHTNRNLCEDVVNVCDLEPEEVAACAEIELRPDADTEEVHAEILYRLLHHVSPAVPFHSLDEMLEAGRSVDEIFEGPLLDHGFIDAGEMAAIRRKCEIRASDVVQVIMDVNGVMAVKNLTLLGFIDGELRTQADWQLALSDDRFRIAAFAPWRSKLIFYKRGLPYYGNVAAVKALFKEKKAADIEVKLKSEQRALALTAGEPRAVGDYLPVQYELPINYCVGRIRVPGTEPVRQAQSRQLKAYLMFFEQLCANHLAQLANVGELFTWRDVDFTTYFTAQVAGVLDFDDLDNSSSHGYASFAEALRSIVETPVVAEERRLRFLEHLTGRYAEDFDEYSALMRALVRSGLDAAPGWAAGTSYAIGNRVGYEGAQYECVAAHVSSAASPPPQVPERWRQLSRLIAHKRRFLDDYPEVGAARGIGFDWRHPAVAANIAGYQRRAYRLLDIDPVTRRHLAGHRFVILNAGTTDAPAWRFDVRGEDDSTLFQSITCESKSAIESLLDLALRLGGDAGNYVEVAGGHDLAQQCAADAAPEALGRTTSAGALPAVVAYFTKYGASEGFHVIEHVLLRKRTLTEPFLPVQIEATAEAGLYDCACPTVRDPYSFRVSIVLPSWSPRFRDIRFRRLVEDTLRREAPAHVFPRICWINHEQMRELEVALDDWQARLALLGREPAACGEEDAGTWTGRLPLRAATTTAERNYARAVRALVDLLYGLTNVYPLAQLHDCEEVSGDTPQITLGHTSLGTL